MIRYQVESINHNNQNVELDLKTDGQCSSLTLNLLAGGMKGENLEKLTEGDSLWIDIGEDRECLKENNASKIKRIYIQRQCYENLMFLLYER